MARLPTAKVTQNTITPPVEEYAAPNVDFDAPDTPFALSLTLNVPVAAVSYSQPGQFPLVLSIPVPMVDTTLSVLPATQNLTLTLNAPSLTIDSSEDAAGPQTLTLTLLAPSLIIDSNSSPSSPGYFALNLTGPNELNPQVGRLTVTIRRYISDPIVTGGCPQCGTFLYKEYGAKKLKSEAVFRGRSFDIHGEDTYYFCARCKFPVKVKRHPPHRKGAWTGWGLRYDEIEAGESDISYP